MGRRQSRLLLCLAPLSAVVRTVYATAIVSSSWHGSGVGRARRLRITCTGSRNRPHVTCPLPSIPLRELTVDLTDEVAFACSATNLTIWLLSSREEYEQCTATSPSSRRLKICSSVGSGFNVYLISDAPQNVNQDSFIQVQDDQTEVYIACKSSVSVCLCVCRCHVYAMLHCLVLHAHVCCGGTTRLLGACNSSPPLMRSKGPQPAQGCGV